MLTAEMREILSGSQRIGWVLEPRAKHLLSLWGLDTPRFCWTERIEEAIRFAEEVGYGVVMKVVSPMVIHKSDRNGVELGIENEKRLREAFSRLSKIDGFAGVLVEEMVSGVELIIGAKIDFQFGPIILLGIGGILAEIYRDVVLRMAPLTEQETDRMIHCLRAHQLLDGYRGSQPIDLKKLKRLLLTFSSLVMEIEGFIESIDLNPVICSKERCVVADARIILKSSATPS